MHAENSIRPRAYSKQFNGLDLESPAKERFLNEFGMTTKSGYEAFSCAYTKYSSYGPLKSSTWPPWKCQIRVATSSMTS